MQILLMFDLPVKTKLLRKVYTSFHKYLLKNGFDMIQFSIYTRHCPNYDAANGQVVRLSRAAPKRGSIRYLIVTEKQFAEMGILAGEKTTQELVNDGSQLVFF
ncbi:CRISPR-associated endonuclease Cas2 [Candidatus Woesebacteria bacterium]|nr:CRISPR-associated endonuclease Cas2 [Candidatus Woesebacteria bacterium]